MCACGRDKNDSAMSKAGGRGDFITVCTGAGYSLFLKKRWRERERAGESGKESGRGGWRGGGGGIEIEGTS